MNEKGESKKSFKWLIIIVGVLMLTTIIVQRNFQYSAEGDEDDGIISHLNEGDFSKRTAEGVVVVDYWAPWCKPCKLMNPVLEEIAHEYEGRAGFYKVNIDNNRKLSGNNNITMIPTLVIMKDGEEVRRFLGIQDQINITDAIDEFLVREAKE